jgi:hypothetical protein
MPLTPYDDDLIDPVRPGGTSAPDSSNESRVPKELRDEENLIPDEDEAPGFLDEEALDPHREVAEVVGTDELPCGIGDTEYPCGVMSDEDPDSSGGASDVDQGF